MRHLHCQALNNVSEMQLKLFDFLAPMMSAPVVGIMEKKSIVRLLVHYTVPLR